MGISMDSDRMSFIDHSFNDRQLIFIIITDKECCFDSICFQRIQNTDCDIRTWSVIKSQINRISRVYLYLFHRHISGCLCGVSTGIGHCISNRICSRTVNIHISVFCYIRSQITITVIHSGHTRIFKFFLLLDRDIGIPVQCDLRCLCIL